MEEEKDVRKTEEERRWRKKRIRQIEVEGKLKNYRGSYILGSQNKQHKQRPLLDTTTTTTSSITTTTTSSTTKAHAVTLP